MIDLGSEVDIGRLYAAMDTCRDGLEPFRRNRKDMIKEFVGSKYNDSGARFDTMVNLMNITADVYSVGLAANNPKIKVRTTFRDLWPFAHRWTQSINNYYKEIRFAQTQQAIVLDAFFTIGIGKVFQGKWQSIQLEDDIWADPGRAHCSRISIDDFGLDLSAKDIRKCKFMWDEYRVSWDSLKKDKTYESKLVKKLSPTSKWPNSQSSSSDITDDYGVDRDEYEPMVDLMDVWLPDINKIAVFPRHQESKPLKVFDAGPEGGPYKFLTFLDVPDNVMPSSPAQNLYELHMLYNYMIRKQARQAKRQKTNPIYQGGASQDATRLKFAQDGEFIKVSNPKNVGVMNQGGVDQASVAFSINVFDMFDRAAGNLSAKAGLGAQTATVGQEEMLNQAVSQKEANMQNKTHRFNVEIAEAIGHLMWADEVLNINSNLEIGNGTGVYVDNSWTPELREGDFFQYNFEIQPYSMNYQPQGARAAKLEKAASFILQLLPIIQQSGGTIDFQELIREYADSQQLPELENIVSFATPSNQVLPGPASVGGMPKETTRNYNRVNVPTGGTARNRDSVLQQSLLSQGGNPSQLNQDQVKSLTLPQA